ncbi:MAG: ATP-binding protein [Fimbriimonas sp.]
MTRASSASSRFWGGYPLAIRLAASRLKLLHPGDLATQLLKRLDILKSDAPDLPERHRSLSNTIDWSIDSLQPAQRAALLRLTSWRGTMDVAYAEALVDDSDAMSLLEALIDASLLSMDDSGDEVRLQMLEPVRHFSRLGSDAHLVVAADRAHAKLIRQTVEGLMPDCLSPMRFDEIERMDSLRENVLSAYSFLISNEEWLEASLLLRRFARHQVLRGGHKEFLAMVQFLDPSWNDLPVEVRADLLASRGGAEIAMTFGNRGHELLKEAVELYESIGRLDAAADLHSTIGFSFRRQNNFDDALFWIRKAIEKAKVAKSTIVEARGNQLLGIVLQYLGDYIGACEAVELSYRALKSLDEDMLRTIAGQLYSAFLFDVGRRDEAMMVAREVKPLLERLGDPVRIAYQHEVDGRAAFDIGDLATAEYEYRASNALWTRLQVGMQIADQKLSIARCLLRRGGYEEAASLLIDSATYWKQEKDWIGLTRTLTVFSRIRAAQGRTEEARGAFAWALELNRRFAPPLEPRDEHDLGMARAEVGDADLPSMSPDAPPSEAFGAFRV